MNWLKSVFSQTLTFAVKNYNMKTFKVYVQCIENEWKDNLMYMRAGDVSPGRHELVMNTVAERLEICIRPDLYLSKFNRVNIGD